MENFEIKLDELPNYLRAVEDIGIGELFALGVLVRLKEDNRLAVVVNTKTVSIDVALLGDTHIEQVGIDEISAVIATNNIPLLRSLSERLNKLCE